MNKFGKNTYDIKSYEDLLAARDQLKKTIKEQEQSFNNNPIVKIADAFKSKNSLKDTLLDQLPEIKFETGEKIISSLLLSNKVTRKYFAGYLVAKEMVPYLIKKVKDLLNTKEKIIEPNPESSSN